MIPSALAVGIDSILSRKTQQSAAAFQLHLVFPMKDGDPVVRSCIAMPDGDPFLRNSSMVIQPVAAPRQHRRCTLGTRFLRDCALLRLQNRNVERRFWSR